MGAPKTYRALPTKHRRRRSKLTRLRRKRHRRGRRQNSRRFLLDRHVEALSVYWFAAGSATDFLAGTVALLLTFGAIFFAAGLAVEIAFFAGFGAMFFATGFETAFF